MLLLMRLVGISGKGLATPLGSHIVISPRETRRRGRQSNMWMRKVEWVCLKETTKKLNLAMDNKAGLSSTSPQRVKETVYNSLFNV